MTITLTPEMEEIVNRKIGGGQFNSASEVVGASLRLFNELDEPRLEELKREIAKGIESLDRGEGTPLDIEAIKAEGRRILAERSGDRNGTSHHIS